MADSPYNPLSKGNLAKSIAEELLDREVKPLSDFKSVVGAGVYAIYYTGSYRPYHFIAKRNREGEFALPIYVGKAVPKGARGGGLGADASKGTSLRGRLRKHHTSVVEAENLKVEDFHFRFLVVDDIWIPLGENMLIELYKPIWNVAITGFGINVPGERRKAQFRSEWDILHPGRKVAEGLGDSGVAASAILAKLTKFRE